MLNFKGHAYHDPKKVSAVAKKMRQDGAIREAKEMLEMSLAKWPSDTYLRSQLILCTRDPEEVWKIFEDTRKAGVSSDTSIYTSLISVLGKAGQLDRAWSIFEDMRKNRVIPDSFTYNSLLSAFYKHNKHAEILQRLDPKDLPMESLPAYSDALRKNRRYTQAIGLCSFVMECCQDTHSKEYAWIVMLYCLMHTDQERFKKEVAKPIIDSSSLQYPRFLTAKVFGNAYESSEKEKLKETLIGLLAEKRRSAASMKDIMSAVDILSE